MPFTKDAGVMDHVVDKCPELVLANSLSKWVCSHFPSEQLQGVSVLKGAMTRKSNFI